MVLKSKFRMRVNFAAAILVVFLTGAALVSAQDERLDRADKILEEANSLVGELNSESLSKAFAKYEEARNIFSELGEKDKEGKALVGLGFTASFLGNIPDAIGYYEKAIPLFVETENDYWRARTLNNLARIHDETGNPYKALKILDEVLPLRRKAGDLNGEAVSLNSAGSIYSKIGEYTKSLEFYEKALALRYSSAMPYDIHNRRGIGIILNNIGYAYRELGSTAKAELYLLRSLSMRRATGDRFGEANTLNNLGLINQDKGDLDPALKYFDESLEIFISLGLENQQATALNNIGVILMDRDDPDAALERFNAARELHKKAADRPGEAVTLNNIALIQERKGNAAATETLNSALLLSRQTGEKSLEAMTSNNLMQIWKERGNPAVASFYGKQSVNTYQDIRRSIHTLSDDVRRQYVGTITDTYRMLADLLIELGQFAQAKQVLNMLKAEEYFDFVRRNNNEIKNLESKVALTEREKELLKRYSEIADRVTELSREYSELDKKRRFAYGVSDADLSKNEKQAESLRTQLEDANAAFRLFVEKQLLEEIGKNRVSEIEYDRSLQSKLRHWGNGTVAIYTVVTEDRYRVVLTTPFVQVAAKTEIKAAELNKKVFEFREALQDLSSDPREKGKELYDLIIKPIEKDLKISGAKTLVWSLDGTLRYIPVGALSPDGKTYLIEHYQSAVITAKTRDDIGDSQTEWKALGLGVSKAARITDPGDPESWLDFSAIPGSVKELNSIVRDERNPDESGLLSGIRLLDEEFTKASFERSLQSVSVGGKPKYSVVHLASHFRLGTNWSDSFLLMGDGKFLTLEQISNSPDLNFGDVELVTLSACDTAFAHNANGKEIDSLAEAIQTKSGKAVLATLWAVVDESTPLLMTEFYKLRKNNPEITKADAIQQVQKAFISGHLKPDDDYIERLAGAMAVRGSSEGKQFEFDKTKPFAHPYFWSPFVLIGNWR